MKAIFGVAMVDVTADVGLGTDGTAATTDDELVAVELVGAFASAATVEVLAG